MKNIKYTSAKVFDMAYIALFAVVITICSWISIPTVVPFTMQTFGVFLAVVILGGKRGTISVLIYILLGAVGVPVFSGPAGGLAKLLGPTGGYIIGFIISPLIYWIITKIYGNKLPVQLISLTTGLLSLYVFGTAWFMIVYEQSNGAITLATALSWCVIPFIVPDLIKLLLALLLSRKILKHIKIY